MNSTKKLANSTLKSVSNIVWSDKNGKKWKECLSLLRFTDVICQSLKNVKNNYKISEGKEQIK